MVRLRQVVVAAPELGPAVDELRRALPLGEPFSDPGVALFGLENAVMALGDTFVEVVAPVQAGTAAGRFLERRGPGPYMLMFQVSDVAAVRARAADEGVREAWSIALDDITAVHLHPADFGAAIVSVDQPEPAESWRWAGPEWEGGAPAGVGPERVVGATVAAADPRALRARWERVLGRLEGVSVIDGAEGVIAFQVKVPGRGGERVEAAGVVFEVHG